MIHPGALGIALMALAGLGAGAINVVVGSGTLITFPLLLALGYPPVVANVSNTVGLVPGSALGAVGYRSLLIGQRERLARLATAAAAGGVAGALLLLVLPEEAFRAIVPALVGLGCLLVLVGPRLASWIATRRRPGHGAVASPGLVVAVALIAVYGGYFGAGQGVLLIGAMGILLEESLQRINALKNVLAGLTNLSAGVVFVFTGHVAWLPALVIALSSAVGGVVGTRLGRRLSPAVLRVIIVAIGIVTIARLV
jgi:uncharacterized membrane protein YfcA